MALSGELLALHHKEDDYKGDEFLVGTQIYNKTTHMVAGVSNAGKTTLIEHAVPLVENSAMVGTVTDRGYKEDDPGNYVYFSSDHIKFLINDDQMVNYAVHPATGKLYGTLPESFPAKHNFLPTMVTSMKQIERAGFDETTRTYITMEGVSWRGLIEAVDFKGSRRARMEEGITSLTTAEQEAETFQFVRNVLGETGLKQATNDLIAVTVGGEEGYDRNKAVEDIREMLAIAKDLAVRSE
ncbi:MAG: hypothetical protein JWO99_374 [Candidatus Saccharibacteria bacterium]|nr:hypothetical protein [Candidatus Saccharibacteria bacterium]